MGQPGVDVGAGRMLMGVVLIAGSGGLRVWGRFRSGCLWGGVVAVWDLGRFASLGLGVSGSFGAFWVEFFLRHLLLGISIFFCGLLCTSS